MAATADVGVERRPVGVAKLSQGSACHFRVRLSSSRRHDHAPVGGRERISLAVKRSGQILHPTILTIARDNAKPHEKARFRAAEPREPVCKWRKQSSRKPNEPV